MNSGQDLNWHPFNTRNLSITTQPIEDQIELYKLIPSEFFYQMKYGLL